MTDRRFTCTLGSIAALMVVMIPVTPLRAAAPPSGAMAEILRGCWSLDPVADGQAGWATYCFNPNGYVSGVMIARSLGSDFCARWTNDGSRAVLFSFGPTPDACGFAASSDGRSFDLSQCREAGHWRRDTEFDLTTWPCDASSLD